MPQHFVPKILFTYFDDPQSTFIRQDFQILEKWYSVLELPLINYGSQMKAFLNPYLWQAVARSDIIVGWFGSSAPAVLAGAIFKKPSIIIAGGADVVNIPAINYGLSSNRSIRYLWFRLAYSLAAQVLLFSRSSQVEFGKLMGEISSKSKLLYLGVDADHFKPGTNQIKQKQLFTASFISALNLRRKGVQTFMDTAALLPQIPFRLAGKIVDEKVGEYIHNQASPNLNFLGYLDDARLLNEYQRSKIYVQVSLHEGFGMALAEAMACECIPIVTNCGSIPEVVGDTGIYVPPENPDALSVAALTALEALPECGARARDRIISLFSMLNREQGLREVIETTLEKRFQR